MEALMKRALLALCVVAFAADAQAISRYTSTSMSCQRIHSTIQRQGAAIMQYRSARNPTLPLYGRYVADGRFCKIDEIADTVSIPAADTKRCPVRQCKYVDPRDEFFLLFDD
jgi:hypothetical protein